MVSAVLIKHGGYPGSSSGCVDLGGGRRSEPFCEVAPRVMKRPRLLSRCRLLVPSRFVSASRTMVSAVLIKHGGYPGSSSGCVDLGGGRRSEPFCEVAPRVMKRPRLLSRCRLLVPSRSVSASRTMVSAVLGKHGGYPGSSSGSVDWTGEDDRRGGACSSRRYGAIMATRALAVDKGLLCMYISPAKILRLTLRMTGRARSNIMT